MAWKRNLHHRPFMKGRQVSETTSFEFKRDRLIPILQFDISGCTPQYKSRIQNRHVTLHCSLFAAPKSNYAMFNYHVLSSAPLIIVFCACHSCSQSLIDGSYIAMMVFYGNGTKLFLSASEHQWSQRSCKIFGKNSSKVTWTYSGEGHYIDFFPLFTFSVHDQNLLITFPLTCFFTFI